MMSLKTMSLKKSTFIASITIAAVSTVSLGDIVLSDDFESGLALWTGKNGGAHYGVVVSDPFDSLNSVLSFNGKRSGGDMFSIDSVSLAPEQSYQISFDYLGLAQERSRDNDTGGYVGFSVGTPSRHSWQWATGTVSGASDVLIDDGKWHSYNFEFTSADLGIGSEVRLMLEDFSGSGGVSGDAYFDNFSVSQVPAPATAALLALGGLYTARRRR
jgi:hypothetical protein